MVVYGSLSTAMNAKIFGTGDQTLVLAHGYGADQSIWDNIVPGLSNKYRVVTFDWNFSGNTNITENKTAAVASHLHQFDSVKYSSFDSYADDLLNLIEEMELTSCIFIGHSMSGMIGCIASIKKPQLFKHLILIGASPKYMNSQDYEGGFEKSDIEQLLTTIELNFHGWASVFAPLATGGKDIASSDKFERSLRRMRPEVALALAKMIFLGDQRDVLERVVTPSTIVQTTNDIVVPSSVGYYMQKKMGKSCIVEIIDTDGHFPQLTASQELINVICKSVAGL